MLDTFNWVGQSLVSGRFHVIEKLGEGGMVDVYKALDSSGSEVVVKVPRHAILEEPSFAAKFSWEIHSLSRLQHPHIVSIIAGGEHAGRPFVVLEYLVGRSLRDRMCEGRQKTPEDLRIWLAEIASVLDFCHQNNYVHGDVKPDNILFDADGKPHLSNLGIVKAFYGDLTGIGRLAGTPQYMAPEVVLGRPCDGRVDQYALAVTVYELLSGRVPFEGRTPAIILQQMSKPAPPLSSLVASIPGPLSAIVQRALDPNPEIRFLTCQAFAAAVLEANWVGHVIANGRYQVVAKLSESGMAYIYRAVDRERDCDVAIKALRPGAREEPTLSSRFTAKLCALAHVTHPHIVRLLDTGEHDGLPFAVLPFLPGGSLRDRLWEARSTVSPRPLRELSTWLQDIASALDFCHQNGCMHGDVRPDNVLFDTEGRAYLSDAGIARGRSDDSDDLSKPANIIFGMPDYEAPEIMCDPESEISCSNDYDGRADQYSLAVTVFETVSGRVLFCGPSSAALIVHKVTENFPLLESMAPSAPPALLAVIRRALSGLPEDRFPDCLSFANKVLMTVEEGTLSENVSSSAVVEVSWGKEMDLGAISGEGSPVATFSEDAIVTVHRVQLAQLRKAAFVSMSAWTSRRVLDAASC